MPTNSFEQIPSTSVSLNARIVKTYCVLGSSPVIVADGAVTVTLSPCVHEVGSSKLVSPTFPSSKLPSSKLVSSGLASPAINAGESELSGERFP